MMNLIRISFSDKSNKPVMDSSGSFYHLCDHQVSSSNLVELKQLQSSIRNSVEKLDYISTIASNARQEFLKLKKVLKPEHLSNSGECSCKGCQDLDTLFRNIESLLQPLEMQTTLSEVEANISLVKAAYRHFKQVHSQ